MKHRKSIGKIVLTLLLVFLLAGEGLAVPVAALSSEMTVSTAGDPPDTKTLHTTDIYRQVTIPAADRAFLNTRAHAAVFSASSRMEDGAKKTVLSKTLTLSSDDTYLFTATYDRSAGLPAGLELVVREPESADTAERVARSLDLFGGRNLPGTVGIAFDVALIDPSTGAEYQPDGSVQIEIRRVGESSFERAAVVHFPDAPESSEELLDTDCNGASVRFSANGFSVFVLCGYTVDFHNGDYVYSIAGESEIALSALLAKLGVKDLTVSDVADVSFSDDTLIAVERLNRDWTLRSLKPFKTEEKLTLTLNNGQTFPIRVTDADGDPGITSQRTYLEGSWAGWRIELNPNGDTLNGGENLTLRDTFSENQSIDYASVQVTAGVTYDYSGNTGTFVIPDGTPITLTYRTRVKGLPGELVSFGNTVVLQDSNGTTIGNAATNETGVIYPSASDVAGFGNHYGVKMYVYPEREMQQGVPGAQFALLDANQRPMEFKKGANAGTPVTFTTGADGYANIELFEEEGDVSIEKNTVYYLAMVKTPEGYQKDNTLYNFMITDDPNYNSGGVYKYYNGDTMKVRLYPVGAGLRVSVRFSGNYPLNEEQMNGVNVVLQRELEHNVWEEVERHSYTDTQWGAISFTTALQTVDTYRVIEENDVPWDLPETIKHAVSYYCSIGNDEATTTSTPQEFYVQSSADTVDIVIDNRYENPQLTITKMDKSTGDLLAGAEFKVFRIENGVRTGGAVKTYTTGSDGMLEISGDESFESEVLYGIVETAAPDGYLLPISEQWYYFYFCNDDFLISQILQDLPAGETAVNLSETFESLTLDNQKELITVPVMKIWQGGTWPTDVTVVLGLYQSVNGSEPTAVPDRTVVLSALHPYSNTAFTGLPSRDNLNREITYSVREEHVYTAADVDILDRYVQEYGVSSAGVYVVRNRPATTLTVMKEWYSADGSVRITDPAVLAEQSPVTFDVYRSIETFTDTTTDNGISNDDITAFIGTLEKVREGLTFGMSENWQTVLSDLEKQDDLGNLFHYYVLETVPSFGNEFYEINTEGDTITIRNKIKPEAVALTVTKGYLIDDPRPESAETDFEFTLKLQNETHVIRSWQVYTDGSDPANDLVTDRNGEVRFTLKAGHSITLSLPAGVTATVTETEHPEYTTRTSSPTEGDHDGRIFTYNVTAGTPVATTFYNTLRVVCKVVDDNGNAYPFESLKSAFHHLRSNPEHFTSPWTIYMLEDYSMPATDLLDVREDEVLTLTTASTTDALFEFKGGAETDRATITRAGNGSSLFTNEGTLNLTNICIDGNKTSFTATGDGGIVNSTGILNLNDRATLRNSASDGKGGAISATGTINIVPGAEITGNSASSGSAISLEGTLNLTGGSITGNSGAHDGAVTVMRLTDRVYLSGTPVVHGNTGTNGTSAANLYIGVDNDNVLNVIAPGLAAEAHIGISALDGHMEIGEQFANAEYGITDHLGIFVNDEYGYRGKLKEGTSTNIVWDGLTLTIEKSVAPAGANPNDRFVITISSPNIKKTAYTVDGTLDYTVTAARQNRPGRIVIRNVKDGDVYTITPLPVGSYTITESESNYTPAFTLTEAGSSDTVNIVNSDFTTQNDCTITVTNTRREANVKLTKTLRDRLAAAAVGFGFTLNLRDPDGTFLNDFTFAEGITTDESGNAASTLSPSNTTPAVLQFRAPVGSLLTITETANDAYRLTTSAVTAPQEGAGEAIENQSSNNNTFAFTVTDDGAEVTFANVRKMAEIELRKTLVNKVSEEETFTLSVTLKNSDNSPARLYTLYEDDADPANKITTDENGQATIVFALTRDVTSLSRVLTIPEQTKLTVTETDLNNNHTNLYDTTVSKNGGTATAAKTITISPVTEADTSIVFTNTRKTNTITVKNTVGGYSGNVVPFTFTATVSDGTATCDYDARGFTDGVQTFVLTTGQSMELVVPQGATLNVTEGFIVGYETTVKHGNTGLGVTLTDEFEVTANVTAAFTNTQFIGLAVVNHTTSDLEGIQVYIGYGSRAYRVNDAQDDQTAVTITNKWVTLDIAAGKTALLEIEHQSSVTFEQAYTVKGNTPTAGYYYTITNEPSFHEHADPAFMRVYDNGSFEVKGKLRYSVSDSTVTITEQPLVSYDANGGVWTTEMVGYHDRDGDRSVYQYPVDTGDKAPVPPALAYPSANTVPLLGWSANETFAKASHTAADAGSPELYDFETPVSGPLTLYAVWQREAGSQTVTLKNALNTDLSVTVTLSSAGNPAEDHLIYKDSADSGNNIATDVNGQAVIPLSAGEAKSLIVPTNAKLVLAWSGSAMAVSTEFTDSDTADNSFTIDPVKRNGTVSFVSGVCKITDADGMVLYTADGNPAVFTTLSAAFTAYNGTLYTAPDHMTAAVQAAVKMLVDEYAITAKTPFPTRNVILTTAGKDDTDFPYAGTRERATLYRSSSFTNGSLFTHEASATTVIVKDIVLDGRDVALVNTVNGGLISVNYNGAVLSTETGAIFRNVSYQAYDSNTGGRGGAIYATKGTLNVNAGLFTELTARTGGAIYVDNCTLNVSGTQSSTQFINCATQSSSNSNYGGDGGAIFYKSGKALTVNGGTDKDDPGIIFTNCVGYYSLVKNDGSDGGAIYAETNSNYPVTISGCRFTECSAKSASETNAANGGGAICANKVSDLNVSHCEFTACDTLSRGGAIAAFVKNGGIVSISNCSFDRCNCKGQGGAIAAYQPNQESASVINEANTTKLSVTDCYFSHCSSGTQNGSGGAIQCYLPCMEFADSTFTDCWAGKEGGAINNYFANGYTAVWAGTYMTVTGCRFIRCRAEDRYDPTALQHYGGGINTKAQTATVTDSYFEDCVSTLKEGGALHLGGQGTGSKATVTGCTFKNCSAKNGGGALLASAEALTVSNSNFYGCSSSGSNGGAVYHYRNSRGDSSQNSTTITGCVFSADPAAPGSEACSAALNGGAIWTRAKTVSIENCSATGCTAGGNGGAIYLRNEKNTPQTATITGGTITGCTAVNGSAVYQENSATYVSVNVTRNTANDPNGGAVAGGTMYFEGDTVVRNNIYSGDNTPHNVVLHNNNNTTIHTTATGLTINADIGVYAINGSNIFANHGNEAQPFGTFGGDAYLDSFCNDRAENLTGYRSITDNSDTKIYWGTYICKITDAAGNTLKRTNGRDAIYQKLSLAFSDFDSVKGASFNSATPPVYVKMLIEEYQLDNKITSFPHADFTLTTADVTDARHPYRGTPGTVCLLHPSNGQLFGLSYSETVFRLSNITLDGRINLTSVNGDYRLIEVTNGKVVVDAGTTMQNGFCPATWESGGGAIYCKSNGEVLINGYYDTESHEPTVRFFNCTADGEKRGGAIYANNLTITNSSTSKDECGTVFINCTAAAGGAITFVGDTVTVSGALFQNCHSSSEGGAFFHDKSSNNTKTWIRNSRFENCYTNTEVRSYGGAVATKAQTLTVEGCEILDCYAGMNGGAINHGAGQDKRDTTSIQNTVINGCSTTKTGVDYGFGGSVFTQAKNVYLTGSTVMNSFSGNNGGGLCCYNADAITDITDTAFDSCSVVPTFTEGAGGAIYSKSKKTLTIKGNSMINACTAPGYSGAVHMDSTGATINIQGNTVISGCCARQGGAICLNLLVNMNLRENPEFTNNGFATVGGVMKYAETGACIYLAERSKLDLAGNPKFSRNIIPNIDRIANGGILDNVRQDIYLAGYSGSHADSIKISGELGGDTIWVWPEKSPHRIAAEQFAETDPSVSTESLNKFRNALADSTSGCSNGEYLGGVRIGTDTTNVYWSKMYIISFKKVDNKGVAVPSARFTLYKDPACTLIQTTGVSADGEFDTDAHGNLLERGYVEFTSIPIGAYYMKETGVPVSFKANNATYLILVGSPFLNPNDTNRELWEGDGPLNVENAATLVARHTTDSGRYYGIFPLDENNKAVLRANLASHSVGIGNVRNDFPVWFKKVDADGNALPGAAFTIYTPILDVNDNPSFFEDGYPELMLWSRDGENYPEPVLSADGTSNFRDATGKTLAKGTVYFRELPLGTYYLLETAYPERNGSNRRAFYAESDRVFRLVIAEDTVNIGNCIFTLYEWVPTVPPADPTYEEMEKSPAGDYLIRNREVVCKLTDAHDNLLYVQGHEIRENKNSTSTVRLFPAIYSTLEEGFASAQTNTFVYEDGTVAADADLNPQIKLQMLKDYTLTQPIVYDSVRDLVFTTAPRSGTRYIFSTNRTTNVSTAEIRRGYSETDANGALFTVRGDADLTLTKIILDGSNGTYMGRAIHTESGKLTINANSTIRYFTQELPSADGTVRGGAVLMDSGSALSINGGSSRTAVFSHNKAGNTDSTDAAEGGAVALSDGCTVESFQNVQFKNNAVLAKEGKQGNGGAISTGNASLHMQNAHFTSNTASNVGGAIIIGTNGSVVLTNGTLQTNSAINGSAIGVGENAVLHVSSGVIQKNQAYGTNGGAIGVINGNAELLFDGDPIVYNNKNQAGYGQRNVVLHINSNEVIKTTANGITGGKIGVFVAGYKSATVFREHGRAGKPFGTFEDTGGHLNAGVFWNDRDSKLYGVRNEDDPSDDLIYWVLLGTDLKFMKVNDTGAPLAGAEFTLYTDAACTAPFELDEEIVKATSSDGTLVTEGGETLASGVVCFEKIPDGLYYMKETASPEGYEANGTVYVVLVGESTLGDLSTEPCLSELTEQNVTDQTSRYSTLFGNEDDPYDKYAIFRIDGSTGKAAADPSIAANGIVNDSVKLKFLKTDGFGNGLNGATFTLFTSFDSDGHPAGITATAVSSKVDTVDGIVSFEKIPDGVYYLMETTNPEGYEVNDNIYLVLLGENALAKSISDTAIRNYLTDITPAIIQSQTRRYKTVFGDGYDKYAIFKLAQVTSGEDTVTKAVAIPDIATFGIMNISVPDRAVILSKINQSLQPVPGAHFNLLRYDRTVVETDLVSDTGGVFYVGRLPYGIYLLEETVVPTGYTDPDHYFVFALDEDGAHLINPDGSVVDSSSRIFLPSTSEDYLMPAEP